MQEILLCPFVSINTQLFFSLWLATQISVCVTLFWTVRFAFLCVRGSLGSFKNCLKTNKQTKNKANRPPSLFLKGIVTKAMHEENVTETYFAICFTYGFRNHWCYTWYIREAVSSVSIFYIWFTHPTYLGINCWGLSRFEEVKNSKSSWDQ